MAPKQLKDGEVDPAAAETSEEQELTEDELEQLSGGNSQNPNWANHHTGGDGTGSHFGE